MRVLIVEDSPAERARMVSTVRSLGHDVHAVEDGLRGLSALKTWGAEVLLCDLNLPGMSGIEVLRIARSVAPTVPTIMCTTSTRLENVVDAMRLGAMEYLIKPPNRGALEAALSRAEETIHDMRRKERFIQALTKQVHLRHAEQTRFEEEVEQRQRDLASLARLFEGDVTDGLLVAQNLIGNIHPGLREHADRVAKISTRIATRMGVHGSDLRSIEIASRVHDVGAISHRIPVLIHHELLQAPHEPDDDGLMEALGRAATALEGVKVAGDAAAILREMRSISGRPTTRPLQLASRIVALSEDFDIVASIRGDGLARAMNHLQQGRMSNTDQSIRAALRDVLPELDDERRRTGS